MSLPSGSCCGLCHPLSRLLLPHYRKALLTGSNDGEEPRAVDHGGASRVSSQFRPRGWLRWCAGGGGDEDELAGGKVFACAHTFADLGRANRGARSVAFALHNQDIAEHILAD